MVPWMNTMWSAIVTYGVGPVAMLATNGGVLGGESTIFQARVGGGMHHNLGTGDLVTWRMVIQCRFMWMDLDSNYHRKVGMVYI